MGRVGPTRLKFFIIYGQEYRSPGSDFWLLRSAALGYFFRTQNAT